ncbi:DUF859 family phage minor structural protein [Cuneatibacter sp. NSJ-177]|uniref:DUF859 family phage minor structural protein n=1 Tax=Cuneatibacter sp. NSJ-177 TaxID=2931401 RepID=UPI001FD12A7F|nr:DUF859 family phage minor structural protein [Cuneatibacter sp. NSJ-177]MCJ7837448.1 DUF859 family phage minor structural protein [Cuneatibacter sp. NSJ-177]
MANANYYGHPANDKYTGKLEIYESNNVSANNSTITWYFKVYRNDNYSSSYSRATGNHVVVTMNGATVCDTTECGTVRAPNGEASAYTLASGTTVIGHNADGSKSFGFSATYTNSNSDSISPLTVSGTHSCNTIPRASSVSSTNYTLGSAGTISINRASSSFTHTLQYAFCGLTGTIATNVGTSCSFTPPKSWGSQIPNSTSSWGTIICITYSGGTEIGRSNCTFDVSVSSDMVPSFSSLGVTRVNGSVPSSWGIYVQGKSQAKLTINGAAGSYGSTIKGYTITGGGFSSGSSSFTTGYLGSGTITFSAYVTDSRGRKSATKTVSISVAAYSNPSISSVSTYRCDASGNKSDNGTYFRAFARLSFSSCSSKNALTCTVKYRRTNATSWTTAGTLTDNAAGVFGGGGIGTEASYDVLYELKDAFATTTYQSYVSSAFFLMHFKRGGKGIAIGKTAETDNLLECALPINIAGEIQSSGTFNRGGWNTKTSGALTQIIDHTGDSVHSTIVGRDRNGMRFYGLDMYDTPDTANARMRLYSGVHYIDVRGNGTIETDSPINAPQWKNGNYYMTNYNDGYIHYNATLSNSLSTYVLQLAKPDSEQNINFVDAGSNNLTVSLGKGSSNNSNAVFMFDRTNNANVWAYNSVTKAFNIYQKTTMNHIFDNNVGTVWNRARVYSPGGQFLYICGSEENDYKLWIGVRNSMWTFAPEKPYVTLGQANYKWAEIYSTNSSISTSDKKEKKDIETLDSNKMETFVNALEPVSYKLIKGESGRTHHGMIAQQVEEAMAAAGMTDMDFAGFIRSPKYVDVDKEDGTKENVLVEGEYLYGLRYEEFIAPLISVVQRQGKEINDLKERIARLEALMS